MYTAYMHVRVTISQSMERTCRNGRQPRSRIFCECSHDRPK